MMNRILSPRSLGLSPGCLLLSTACFIALCTAGCGFIANAANALPLTVKAAYPGLAGKTTAVMVWPEPMIKINYPRIQADITASLQQKLMDAQKKDKPDELKGTSFPVS